MKNPINNLTNTQKKVLAGVLFVTLPVWLIPAALCGWVYVGYSCMCIIVGVEE